MMMLKCLLVSRMIVLSLAVFIERDLPDHDVYKPGDLVIAGMFAGSAQISGQVCSTVKSRHGIQSASAMVYALEVLSANTSILPNISLGYVLLDDCSHEGVAMMKASQLVPIKQCVKDGCGIANTSTSHLLTFGTKPQYDVIAVVGPLPSTRQRQTSLLFSHHDIPHMGPIATSDELSDKSRYKYFTRVSPPDRFMARALVDIIDHYNWTYISTLYSGGPYGSLGIRLVHEATKELGVCIAFSQELRDDFTENDYDWVVVQLRKNYKAKVVVYFALSHHGNRVFDAMKRANAEGEFVTLATFLSQGNNVLYFRISTGDDRQFNSFYKQLSPFGTGDNVWSGEYDEKKLDCSWDVPEGNDSSCHRFKTYSDVEGHRFIKIQSRVIDATKTIGFALHHLISEVCPDAFQNKKLLKTCINGPLLLKYIRNTKFKGASGNIEFDSSGDLIGGSYDIVSYYQDIKKKWKAEIVGRWQIKTQQVEMGDNMAIWSKKTPSGDFVRTSEIPESVCAKPCQVGEFYLMGELSCCWECRRCRDNEYLRSNLLGCDICPFKTWPDQVNFTTCEPIPPSYMHWSDPIAIGLMSMAGAIILTTIIITIIFFKNREKKVIKGSSLELMVPIIIGLYLAFATVFFFVAKADDWICYANYLGFNLSCTLIFGPLFLKTLRIYRIFAAADRYEVTIHGVDSRTQILGIFTIFMIQVVINIVMCFYHPPVAEETMPVVTIKHLELSCPLPIINLISPLGYNVLLLLLCAIFGFMTRKLPDNFNESWYIFISVTTTLFVWTAFLPTYFMVFYAHHKSALLAFALILNGVVTVMCLFAPKLYALYYVDESGIKVTNFEFPNESLPAGSTNTRVGIDSNRSGSN